MPVIRSSVRSLSKSGSTQLKGDVTLSQGANVILTQVGQDISIASSGGGASPLTTKGDIYAYSTLDARFPISGNNGYILTEDSGAAFGFSWQAAPAGSVDIGSSIPSGTPGSVLFIGSGSVLAEDNANFFWNDSDNRLGIGTATPGYPLDVSGVNNATRFTNTGPIGTGEANARNHFTQYNAGTDAQTTGWIAAAFGDTTSPRVVIGQADTSAYIGAHSGNLDAWANLCLQNGGGSLGIGAITSPGTNAKLEVNGAGFTDYAIFSDYSTATLRIGTSGSNTIRMYTDGAQPFTITGAGGIFFGSTASPLVDNTQALGGGSNRFSNIFSILTNFNGVQYTFPAADGTAGYVLSTNASGTLSWVQNGPTLPLSAANGGTGIDTSASTGVAIVDSGTWSIAAQLAPLKGGTGGDSSGSTGIPHVAAGAWSYSAVDLASGDVTGDIDLTTQVTGVLPIANGGTNSNAAIHPYRIVVTEGTGTSIGVHTALTANEAMITDGNGLPATVTPVADASYRTIGSVTFTKGIATAVSGVQSVADAATITPNADADACVDITAIAQAFTIANATGTPQNFQKLIIRIKDNGTARAITWGSAYVAGGVALPSTSVLSKILTIGFIYNTANSLNKWQCVAAAQEA